MNDDELVPALLGIATSSRPLADRARAVVESLEHSRGAEQSTTAATALAGLANDAASGVVLAGDGTTRPLPGLPDHPLLDEDSPVTSIARRMLAAGQVYRTFLWPAEAATGHVRITVLTAQDLPGVVVGIALVTPQADCRGLTPRELEVLGLVVEGRSNQQIARGLGLSLRTVATHLEHILHKLEVQTRTLAAVLAEREGCHVPPLPGLAVEALIPPQHEFEPHHDI